MQSALWYCWINSTEQELAVLSNCTLICQISDSLQYTYGPDYDYFSKTSIVRILRDKHIRNGKLLKQQ